MGFPTAVRSSPASQSSQPPGDAYSIRVIDSLQFMMIGSLSSLVENQKKEMTTMEEGFPKFCEAFDKKGYDRDTKAFLLKKKNEFPYELAGLL